MKRVIAVLSVLLIGLTGAFLGYLWISDRASGGSERVYREYDRKLRAYLPNATRLVGKKTIKVERLSDQFTVPVVSRTPFSSSCNSPGHSNRQHRIE